MHSHSITDVIDSLTADALRLKTFSFSVSSSFLLLQPLARCFLQPLTRWVSDAIPAANALEIVMDLAKIRHVALTERQTEESIGRKAG